MVDSTRKKRSDGHPFLPERHLTILVGLLVLLILVFSFIILGISVNQIVNGTVDALNTQAETVAEQTVDLFDNYSRLCETLTANPEPQGFCRLQRSRIGGNADCCRISAAQRSQFPGSLIWG